MAKHVSKEEFTAEVLEAKQPVLVDFYADWCVPCTLLSHILEELEEAHPEVKLVKVNIEEDRALAEEFEIVSLPTLLLFEDGGQIGKSVGLKPMEALVEALEL